MLLRVSGKVQGRVVDAGAVTTGESVGSGVRAGSELIAFAEAAVRDSDELPAARSGVAKALGEEALVDAAAIIGNFQRMVRIADGTGIPLDPPMAILSAGLRSELGIDAYVSAKNTPPTGMLNRLLGRILQPFLASFMKRFRPPTARISEPPSAT